MTHQPFVIYFELFTPLVLTHDLTLDSLLSAAVSHETGLRDDAVIPHIPLKQTHGVFHGSILMPSHVHTPRRMIRTSKIGGIRMGDFDPNKYRPNGKSRYLVINKASGDYRNVMSTYQSVLIKSVKFYGCGDMARVEHLVRCYVLGLGKQASRGMGEIMQFRLEELSDDHSLMHPSSGLPMRPIPLSLWHELSDESLATGFYKTQVPYRTSEPVLAVSPASPW